MERMRELIRILNEAAKAYYQDAEEIMSNYEYDRLYDELLQLEAEYGTVLAGSPTQKVGYEVLSELPKERHDRPMLSLDKTKEIAGLEAFLGDKQALISWKLDGLTVVLTYEEGTLVKAVTRGNGEIGEVITPNAKVFENIPLVIPFKGTLVLRGEAVIRYSDFDKINAELPESDAKYKNPRNLCSGSVRQLDSRVTAGRHVKFYAFALVYAEGADAPQQITVSRKAQFDFMASQGFEVVEHYLTDAADVRSRVAFFADAVAKMDVPSDGLVLVYEDVLYSASLKTTAKYPKDAFAFKWADETAQTKLREIEWSPSRTGLINPVAVFDPVELEGTTVSRASVHNVSILNALKLGIGDTLEVYKANMIIPQISANLTQSGPVFVPERCPVCGAPTRIQSLSDVQTLYCTNENCPVRKLKSYALLVSRDALNVDGLSEATLEKLLGMGLLQEYADLFHLDRHAQAITELEGFGEKSYQKLIESINRARVTTADRLLYSLGIPNTGLATAKLILRQFEQDPKAVMQASAEELAQIPGIGPVIAQSVQDYFADSANREQFEHLLAELTLEEAGASLPQNLAGKTFVVTGAVHTFENRKALSAFIEARGGKVAGSVSAKTDYLINNDTTSASSKNQKAKELGIPILSEEDFHALLQ